MNDLVLVKVLRAHANSYGDAHEKAVGDVYELHGSAANLLANEGLVELVEGALTYDDKIRISGRQGSGKGAGADRKGGDTQDAVAAGA